MGIEARSGTTVGNPLVYLNGATIMTTPTSQQLEIARQAGYDGIEARVERLLDSPEETSEAASSARRGEIWSLNGFQLQLTPHHRLDMERLEAELNPRLRLAKELGVSYLLVVPPLTAGVSRDNGLRAMREGIEITRDAAAEAGVKIAFEFLGFSNSLVNTPELAVQLVRDIPGVDLLIDAFHWYLAGSPSLAGFPVDRLAGVHLNDAPKKPMGEYVEADRLLPGLGVMMLTRLVGELRALRYSGLWSVETFNEDYWARNPLEVASEGRRLVAKLLS